MRGGREVACIDLYSYLLEGRRDADIRLEEGDAVVVGPYGLLVEISGNVKRPMWYELKRGETLGRLIEYAGGFTGDAYRDEGIPDLQCPRRGFRQLDDGGRRRRHGRLRAGPFRQPGGGPRQGLPRGDVRAGG